MNKIRGVILKRSGKRLAVVQDNGERTDVYVAIIPSYLVLSEGLIIQYSPRFDYKTSRMWIDFPEIQKIPLAVARYDIIFMHTLIELCYYFIPDGGCASGIVDFFEYMYLSIELKVNFNKKLLICKLLAFLGIYPHISEFQSLIQYLSVTPIDKIDQLGIELAQADLCDEWMQWCIADHVCGRWLKAMPLFMQAERM